MNCHDATDRIALLLADLLPEPEAKELRSHLARCPACAEILPWSPDPAAARRLAAAIRFPRPAAPRRTGLLAAAAAAALLGLSLVPEGRDRPAAREVGERTLAASTRIDPRPMGAR